MVPRYAWLALVLTALPAGAVLASQHAADSLGRALGRDAAAALSGIPIFPRPAPPPVDPEATPDGLARSDGGAEAGQPEHIDASAGERHPRGAKPAARRGKKTQAPSGDQSVFVAAPTVLALASRGVAPRGVPVPAAGPRPAGLRMIGVSALGVGLRDGDVLTRVLGAPATSFGVVVEAVLRARARNARIISGEFWRDGRTHSLSVEQPYVSPSAG